MPPQVDSRSFAVPLRSLSFAMLLCALVCAVLPLSGAHADPYVLDGRWDSVYVLDGEYKVFNNVWGATTAQEVTGDTNSTAFEVTLSEHNSSGVASYPFILKGIHWGAPDTATTGSRMPIQVADVASAPFGWTIDTSAASGKWNAAFESFFSSTGGIAPDMAELMIWINYDGVSPGGSRVASGVSIGGLNWNVYHGSPWASWQHYIAYQLDWPSESVSLDLRDFIDDAQGRGYLDPSWYLDNMEAGFEIWADGEGLRTTSFSAEVIPVPVLPGDYNDDGMVDAADYTVWRDHLGTSADLPNDETPGSVTEDDYTVWKSHFGETSGSGSVAGGAIPEPSSVVLLLAGVMCLALRGSGAWGRFVGSSPAS